MFDVFEGGSGASGAHDEVKLQLGDILQSVKPFSVSLFWFSVESKHLTCWTMLSFDTFGVPCFFSPPPKVRHSWNCSFWWLSEFSGLWSVWGRNSSDNSKLYCLHPTLWSMESTDIHLASSSKHKIKHHAIGLRFSSEKIDIFSPRSWKQGMQFTRSAAKFLLRNQEDVSPSASPSSFHSPSGGREWFHVLCFWVLHLTLVAERYWELYHFVWK